MTNQSNEQPATDVQGFAVDFFLKLEGIKGEGIALTREHGTGQSTGRRSHNSIELASFSWGVSQR